MASILNSRLLTYYIFRPAELIVAITSHYITSDFKLREDLLEFLHIPERHTGRNLATHVHKVLHDYNIHTNLYCITTDNASNNGKMIKELTKLFRRKDNIIWNGPQHHIPCFAHVINLAVKAFLRNLKIAPVSDEHQWSSDIHDDFVADETPDDDVTHDDNDDDTDNNIESDDSNAENQRDWDDFGLDIPLDLSFASALQKVRVISKAANFPQTRILTFKRFYEVNDLKPLRPIRDHAIRWGATFKMAERATYLKLAIDQWTRSKPEYAKFILQEKEWEMIEFLVHFLHPFHMITMAVQATTCPSLHETWVRYEKMFDCLDETKESFQAMQSHPEWLVEVQHGVEKMWDKLREYYDESEKPVAIVDAILLHPKLKTGFMTKANYTSSDISKYKTESERRFKTIYHSSNELTTSILQSENRKRPHPFDSSSSESDAEEINEFTMWLSQKRDKTISNPLEYWGTAGKILFPRLQMMARDVFAVPATGAGVEREFSISGRVITKHRNRLSPKTIRDLMQYKRWVARQADVLEDGKCKEVPMAIDSGATEADKTDCTERERELAKWLKSWEAKETLRSRIARLAE